MPNHPLLRAVRDPHDSITLRESPTGWIAESYGPHADEIVRLFGTNKIPTAFTARAEPMTVLAEIRRLNPGVEVTLGCPIYATPKPHHDGLLEAAQ